MEKICPGYDKTLEYYNENAKSFVESTVAVDFEKTQLRFISKLKPKDYILDFGCGSGRDTKYFLSKGFKVDAIDGAEEICKKASKITGTNVRQMLFQELNEISKYDGIWACSSILHLPKAELKTVFEKMLRALKDNGVIYTSFKFTDFTIETFKSFIDGISGGAVEEYWITGDVRPGRGEEKWLNLLLRKMSF